MIAPRVRSGGILLWCLGATAVALATLAPHDPVEGWLLWRYLAFAGWTAVWLLGCWAVGHLAVRRLSKGEWPFLEEMVQSLALGVLAWGLVTFVFGLAGGLYPYLFVLQPLAFLGAGLPKLIPRLLHVRRVSRRLRLAPMQATPTTLVAWAGLAIGVALLYAMIMSPKFLAYDARWYHVAVAEQWAGVHGIGRSTDGSSLASRPHLANWLYVWAFLWPGSSAFAKLELALHLEFGLVLATLASIPVALRTLTPTRKLRAGAAAALLLFPGIFVYDSTISGGADHVLAFFALPIFLAWRRTYRSFSDRSAVTLALVLAAAFLVKYQAVYFAAGIVLSFVFAAIVRPRREGRRALRLIGRGVGLMAAVGLVVTSPVWATNLVWYGNPVFPFLVHLFPSHPWGPDATDFPDYHDPRWVGSGSLVRRLGASLLSTFTFAFQSNDWPAFHGEWPVYGFLFSLLSPLAFFLRAARRAMPLVLMSLLAIFVWHFTYRQVRYLQALTPWLALAVAYLIVVCWDQGQLARVGLTLLVGLQVAWGSDHPFLPSHAMVAGGSPFPHLLQLAASGYTKRRELRNEVETDLANLSHALPQEAKVLLHERHLILGLERDSIVDSAGTQSALSYRRFRSPREVYDALKALGVTHVFWEPASKGWDHLASDVVFYDYVSRFLTDARPVDGGTVARLPDVPPTSEPRYATLGLRRCGEPPRFFSPLDLDATVEGGASVPPSPVPAAIVVQLEDCPGGAPGPEWPALIARRGTSSFWSQAVSR